MIRRWKVGFKLGCAARYAARRYKLRDGLVRDEEKALNPSLSGYPSNHDYTIRHGQLVPSFQLFERSKLVSALLSPEMDSFLDIGCCRGFYVLNAALRPGCRLAVGVDVHKPFVSISQQAVHCLGIQKCAFWVATLDDLTADLAKFGGPFHTVLNLGTYHYLYWGSNLCSTAYFDHREILRRFAELCTNRVIISGRFEVDRLPAFPKAIAERHKKRSEFTTEGFLKAAAEFFEVRPQGFLGAYPLLLLMKK